MCVTSLALCWVIVGCEVMTIRYNGSFDIFRASGEYGMSHGMVYETGRLRLYWAMSHDLNVGPSVPPSYVPATTVEEYDRIMLPYLQSVERWFSNLEPSVHIGVFGLYLTRAPVVIEHLGRLVSAGNSYSMLIPSWFLVVLSMMFPMYCLSNRLRLRKRRIWKENGCCEMCGYDLHGSMNRCPECGSEFR